MNIICCGAGHVGRSAAEALVAARHDVTVIDVATLKPIKSIKVGRFPWGAAYRPTKSN